MSKNHETAAQAEEAAKATQFTEEAISEEREWPKLRLKNGREVESRPAYFEWRALQSIESKRPEEIAALAALARGEQSAVAVDTLNHLMARHPMWFDEHRRLSPLVRDILLCGLLQTHDGPVIANPFDLRQEADVRLMSELYDYDRVFTQRLLRGDLGRNDGQER